MEKKLSEEEHIAFNPFNSNQIYPLRITFLLLFFWPHYSLSLLSLLSYVSLTSIFIALLLMCTFRLVHNPVQQEPYLTPQFFLLPAAPRDNWLTVCTQK